MISVTEFIIADIYCHVSSYNLPGGSLVDLMEVDASEVLLHDIVTNVSLAHSNLITH